MITIAKASINNSVKGMASGGNHGIACFTWYFTQKDGENMQGMVVPSLGAVIGTEYICSKVCCFVFRKLIDTLNLKKEKWFHNQAIHTVNHKLPQRVAEEE